jgi:hypothetical protein
MSEIKDEYIPKLLDTNRRQELVIAYMYDHIKEPDEIEDSLIQYDVLVRKYYKDRQKIEEIVEHKQSPLHNATHFNELLHLLKLVYEESLPDIRLESKLIYLEGFQEEFRRRLSLESHRSPEINNDIEQLFDMLDKQREGMDLIQDFLNTGDRNQLTKAYNIIYQATIEMLNYNTKLYQEVEQEKQGRNVSCPFCFAINEPTSRNCVKCGRMLPTYNMVEQVTNDLFTKDGLFSAGSSERPLPENLDFIRQVIEETSQGILPFEEAENLLQLPWNTIKESRNKLNQNISSLVVQLGDPSMRQYFEMLKDSLQYYYDAMSGIMSGLKNKNTHLLTQNLPAVLEAGEELVQIGEQLSESLKTRV